MNGYKSRAEQSRVCSHIAWQTLGEDFVPEFYLSLFICVTAAAKKKIGFDSHNKVVEINLKKLALFSL